MTYQAPEPDEIEVTPEMIAAGVDVLLATYSGDHAITELERDRAAQAVKEIAAIVRAGLPACVCT